LPPQHALGRTPQLEFQDDEQLYRRYLADHFVDGELDPSAIRFGEPPSFLRSAFSSAQDALHVDCADGQDVSRFGVLAMQAVSANYISENDTYGFVFWPIHAPLATCYAHSEIHCCRTGDPERIHINPPKNVRKAFRLHLARALTSVIAPK